MILILKYPALYHILIKIGNKYPVLSSNYNRANDVAVCVATDS